MDNNEKLDIIIAKLDTLGKMDTRMGKMESKMDKMDARMGKMESKVDKMDARMGKMESKMDKMDARMNKMESKLDKLDYDVRDVRLTLENETNKNIMRVAEGHLDLSRKLDEALKIDNEKEMIAIRVTILENELRRVKERVEQIA